MAARATVFARQYFHGTRADLAPGDAITVGYRSNFTTDGALSWVYFTSTLDAAIWGAELAIGPGRERIFVVEPTEPFEDDPNLTDKRFPGNPTQAFRSRDALRIVAEVVGWAGHAPEQIAAMRAGATAKKGEIID
jgi:rifampin ADP-ribosylating transferase